MKGKLFIGVLMGMLFWGTAAWAETIKANAVVERRDFFMGEPFVFQIQVSGSESPEKPDLSKVKDFIVTFQGGQQNSSQSVTIVNGKVSRNIRKGYFFSYQMIPNRTGALSIPSINVVADGQSTQTDPVMITVRKPVETDDFKLRLKLSKDHCYVGEPVILTVTWYIGKDVREFNFSLPLLEDDSFRFENPDVNTQSGKKLYRIRLGDDEVIGEKGQGRIKGKDYATLTFKKVLIPIRFGNISIEPATVSANALMGYENRQNRVKDDFFSDFFNDDFFSRGRRGIYRKVVVPSNSMSLRISDLPEEGRPAGFAGHVGEYRIEAAASPTEVNVGDPITLTLSLTGPDYLKYIQLPPLSRQPGLNKDFKIPKERASAEVSGKSKVFTQTIRALRSDVKEIPPIELAYFDTAAKAYGVARTQPVPLIVKETRVLTAMDAEGISGPVSNGSGIETWNRGIAFNYEDMDVIENQGSGPLSWFRSPLWLCLTLGSPVFYGLLLAGTVMMRRRNADPLKSRARKAYGNLTRALKEARRASSSDRTCDMIQDAFRSYLGDKLGLTQAALTFIDVKDKLEAKGIDSETLDRLRSLFEECTAGQYAGNAGSFNVPSLTETGVHVAKALEKKL